MFPPGFTCPAVLWIQLADSAFHLRDSHSLWFAFPHNSVKLCQYHMLSKPQRYCYLWFGLLRFRSPLLTESQLISSPPGTEMFHFPGYRLVNLWIQLTITEHYFCWIAPFGYLRIKARVRLPEAFRSLPRPSSPVGAKASFMCS